MLQGNRGFYNVLGYKDILVQINKRGSIQTYHTNLAIFTVNLGPLPEVNQCMLLFSLQGQTIVVLSLYLNVSRKGDCQSLPGSYLEVINSIGMSKWVSGIRECLKISCNFLDILVGFLILIKFPKILQRIKNCCRGSWFHFQIDQTSKKNHKHSITITISTFLPLINLLWDNT